VVNSGLVNLGALANVIAIPGNLTINNSATVTMVANQGQIAPSSQVAINNGGTLNLTGTKHPQSPDLHGQWRSITPAVNVGTLLNLSAQQAITVTNDNLGTTRRSRDRALPSCTFHPRSNVSGASPNSLVISAPIVGAGGPSARSAPARSPSAEPAHSTRIPPGCGHVDRRANSTPSTGGVLTSGPLGTGTLTIANGTTLMRMERRARWAML